VALFVKLNCLGICHAAGTGFLLGEDPDTVLSLGFAFAKRERMPPRPVWGWSDVVPDLVLLTRAPSTSDEEAQERVALWLKAGAKETWVLDLNRRCLTVHRSNHAPQIIAENEMLTCEDLLPGFSVPLREVFED
jgi:Uma2 family endonuclease